MCAQEQHLTAAQRKRALLALAERTMVQQSGSGAWATASHAGLARPMLLVSAPSLLAALAAALRLAADPAAAEPLLRSLVQLLGLCGVLGMDEQCKQVRARMRRSTRAHPRTRATSLFCRLALYLSPACGAERAFYGLCAPVPACPLVQRAPAHMCPQFDMTCLHIPPCST